MSDPDHHAHDSELVGTMALYAMIASGVSVLVAPRAHTFPYWKKLAEFALDFWSTDPETLAKTLCEFHGVDPFQKSLGLGSLIEKDKPYELWEAHQKTARSLIYGWCVHNAQPLAPWIPDAQRTRRGQP